MSMSLSGLGESLMQQYSSGMKIVDAEQTAINIMRQRDANGDSVLDASESKTLSAEFEGTDANGDGLISINELIVRINAKLNEAGLSSRNGEGITGINQLKFMAAKMSVELLLPKSRNGSSGYDFESLLVDRFNLSGSEANTVIETMKGNPLDLFG